MGQAISTADSSPTCSGVEIRLPDCKLKEIIPVDQLELISAKQFYDSSTSNLVDYLKWRIRPSTNLLKTFLTIETMSEMPDLTIAEAVKEGELKNWLRVLDYNEEIFDGDGNLLANFHDYEPNRAIFTTLLVRNIMLRNLHNITSQLTLKEHATDFDEMQIGKIQLCLNGFVNSFKETGLEGGYHTGEEWKSLRIDLLNNLRLLTHRGQGGNILQRARRLFDHTNDLPSVNGHVEYIHEILPIFLKHKRNDTSS